MANVSSSSASPTPADGRDDDVVALDLARVRDLLRLANRLHGLPNDPAARKQTMLEGLIRLVGGRQGTCVVAHDEGRGHMPVVLSVTRAVAHGSADASASGSRRARAGRPQGVDRSAEAGRGDPDVRRVLGQMFPGAPADPAPAPPGGQRAGAGADAARTLISSATLDAPTTRAGIAVVRGGGANAHPFTPHDQTLVDLVHTEMRWVYSLDVPLASPEVLSLAPRTRQTLQLLLAGNGEKQIAAHLKLSLNTVHHYVKQLYRHFNVSTRSQLLSRWLQAETT